MFTENNYGTDVSLFDADYEYQEEDGFVDTSVTTYDSISEFNDVIDSLHNVDPIALKDAGYLEVLLQYAVEAVFDNIHYYLEFSCVEELYHGCLKDYYDDYHYTLLDRHSSAEDILSIGSEALNEVSGHFSYFSALTENRLSSIMRFIICSGDDIQNEVFGCTVEICLDSMEYWFKQLFEELSQAEYSNQPDENYHTFLEHIRKKSKQKRVLLTVSSVNDLTTESFTNYKCS